MALDGIAQPGKSRDLNNGWADKTAPAIYHRQWASSRFLPPLRFFLPSSHPSRFIVIPNLLSGISNTWRIHGPSGGGGRRLKKNNWWHR